MLLTRTRILPLVDLPGAGALAVAAARVDAWISRERSPEGTFPTAMTLGHPAVYRRRPRRR